MKKATFLFVISALIISCNQTPKENQETAVLNELDGKEDQVDIQEEIDDLTSGFNIEDIPYSDADLGDFPFFSFPEGIRALNKPIERGYDVIYFPIDGVMTPIEGRVFKTNVSREDRKNGEWSLAFFLKSYDDAILAVGGQQIFDGQISKEEYQRYSEEATYLGEDGSIGYTKEKIRVYVIRRSDGKNVFIQLTGNNAGGKLNILQEEGFKQTITKISADDILKDLTDNGKAILYIHFDVDKSNVTTTGEEVVNQIATALQKDNALKIAVEGHTDNTGDNAHNKKLSAERANAVVNALVAQNIDKSRLSAKGYGSEQPLFANDTEDNKAKNRRVELIKVN